VLVVVLLLGLLRHRRAAADPSARHGAACRHDVDRRRGMEPDKLPRPRAQRILSWSLLLTAASLGTGQGRPGSRRAGGHRPFRGRLQAGCGPRRRHAARFDAQLPTSGRRRRYGLGNVTFATYAAVGSFSPAWTRTPAGGWSSACRARARSSDRLRVVLCDGWPSMGADVGGVSR
jgi:hypothetical protein